MLLARLTAGQRQARDGPRAVDLSRLTDVPLELDAPPEQVRAFREVDPRTELIYIGRGKWWVGLVYENIPLIRAGEEELARIKAEGATWPTKRLAMLKAAGWRRVILWDVDRTTNDWVSMTRPGISGWGKMLLQYRRQNEVYLKYPDSDAAYRRLMLRHTMGMSDSKLQRAIERLLGIVQAEKSAIMGRLRGRKMFVGLGGFLKRRAS